MSSHRKILVIRSGCLALLTGFGSWPGHGFRLVNINDWQGAIASTPLSHLGFHAPLLLTSDATSLPDDLDSYFTMVSPSFLNSPADGPYNMTPPNFGQLTVPSVALRRAMIAPPR